MWYVHKALNVDTLFERIHIRVYSTPIFYHFLSNSLLCEIERLIGNIYIFITYVPRLSLLLFHGSRFNSSVWAKQ